MTSDFAPAVALDCNWSAPIGMEFLLEALRRLRWLRMGGSRSFR